MIIKTRGGHDLQINASAEWGTESWIPAAGMGRISESGVPVTDRSAQGIPAVSSVIRSASEIIASMPFMVYRQAEGYKKQARDTWQWELLHDCPEPILAECSSFEFFYDISVSLESTQNAFIQKMKQGTARGRKKMIGLHVVDPQRVRVYQNEDGTKAFDVRVNNETITGLGTEDILHIRGFTLQPGGVCGTSLLDIHRDPLGNAIAMQKFEGDYFRNNAVPPFFFTGATNKQQAADWIDLHNSKHKGVGNQWKVGALWGDADVKAIPLSMRDAMFVQAKNLSIEDICRIWRWPRQLMEIGETRDPQTDLNVADAHVMKIYVLPRIRRIESAFACDPDFFLGSDLYGEFLTAGLERTDTNTRYDSYRLARQGGWITANELRALENLPPLEGGDELQQTPVGGAPNESTQTPSPNPEADPGSANNANLIEVVHGEYEIPQSN